MTVEMGPREVELSFAERVAAFSVSGLTALVGRLLEQHLRYRPQTATLVISGEDGDTGDAFDRGLVVSTLCMSTVMVWLIPILLVPGPETAGPTLSLAVLGVLSGLTLLNGVGAAGLVGKTDVVDHTTPPAPEAIADLEAAYMADEIDERELGEQAEEVWANE